MSEGNDSYTEVTSSGWLSRLGDSFKGIVTGIVLIILATGLLWWNEGRTVRTGDAILEAQMAVVDLPGIDKLDPAFDGKLVYAKGRAVTNDELVDPMFGVTTKAIKLRREMQYYQWVENRKSEKRSKVGGGTETVTTYSYSKQWVNKPVNSGSFKRPEGHENKTRIQAEDMRWLAPNVTFGAYRLPEFLSSSIGGERTLTLSLTDEQRAELQRSFFTPSHAQLEESLYSAVSPAAATSMIHPQGNTLYIGRRPESPAIGDVRVSFFETPAAEISIIAKISGDTFVRFTASNGNTFSHLSMGTQDRAAMFEDAKSGNAMMAWILRVVGVLLCIAGFKMILAPLQVIADVLPLLGSIVGAGAGIVSGLLGFAWSLIIIAIAWIRFRPMLALCLLGGALVLLIVVLVTGSMKKKAAASAPAAPAE